MYHTINPKNIKWVLHETAYCSVKAKTPTALMSPTMNDIPADKLDATPVKGVIGALLLPLLPTGAGLPGPEAGPADSGEDSPPDAGNDAPPAGEPPGTEEEPPD